MADRAAVAGLDLLPDSRLWRLGPSGLNALCRGALRGPAEIVAALYTVNRDPDTHPGAFLPSDVMPDVFPAPARPAPAPEASSDAQPPEAPRLSAHERVQARVRRQKARGIAPATLL